MAERDRAAETSRTWMIRAERARRIASMLSTKDAQAIEAYAVECEARAEQATDRQVLYLAS